MPHVPEPIARWHDIVRTRDKAALAALLADDVVFESPVVHTPQRGRAITMGYLGAAMQLLGTPAFRYVAEAFGDRHATLEFATEVDGIAINGIDAIAWNDAGQVTGFKVFIRPLKAINLVHEKMGAMLAAMKPPA